MTSRRLTTREAMDVTLTVGFVVGALVNTIGAFTQGPVLLGWTVPDGLSGFLGGFLFLLALARLTDRR